MHRAFLPQFLRSAWRYILGVILFAVGHFANGQATGFTPGAKATISECIDVVKEDSTILFYDFQYNLTPMACADIRRHTRVTDNGDFKDETRDYTIATNRLRNRLYYEQAQRHGPYESYFPNGQLAVRGNFTHGEPTGSWEFWYPSGQRKQTFEWTGKQAPRFRILASWDSTGQQGVSNGNGLWQGVMPMLKRCYGGPVVAGLAQGVWESHAVSSGKLLTTEMYEEGIFRSGKALDGGGARYKNHSLLEPQLDDPTIAAERVSLGLNCEAIQAENQRRGVIRKQHLTLQNTHITPPKPPGNTISYLKALLKNLDQTNQRNQWENMVDGQQFIISATTDDQGYLRIVSGQGGSGIATAMTQAVSDMARWQPATVNDKPVVGKVQFLIIKSGVRLDISMQADASF